MPTSKKTGTTLSSVPGKNSKPSTSQTSSEDVYNEYPRIRMISQSLTDHLNLFWPGVTDQIETKGVKFDDGYTYKMPLLLLNYRCDLVIVPTGMFMDFVVARILLIGGDNMPDLFDCYLVASGIYALPREGKAHVQIDDSVITKWEKENKVWAWQVDTMLAPKPLPKKMLYIHGGVLWPQTTKS